VFQHTQILHRWSNFNPSALKVAAQRVGLGLQSGTAGEEVVFFIPGKTLTNRKGKKNGAF